MGYEIVRAFDRHSNETVTLRKHATKYNMLRYAFLTAQVRLWNDLPYTVFYTGTLDGFKGAVNRWLLP